MAAIIITDDEPMNIRMTEFILHRNGYETISAGSGEECLDLVKNGADLVLMDVLMPGLDGLQTYERLRSINSTVPVIFLTSAEDGETLRKISESGAGVLSKPFRPEELLAAVSKALSGSK